MALTPQYDDEILAVVESDAVEPEPSKTWGIDFKNGTLGGFIDEDEALKQFIYKALHTERYKYVIYSNDYGSELKSLVGSGMSRALLESELPRMIKDALEYDDRIEIVNVTVRLEGDKAFVTANVEKVNGEILVEEVSLNV